MRCMIAAEIEPTCTSKIYGAVNFDKLEWDCCVSILHRSHSLEKTLNFRGSPWKLLIFLWKSLKSPWIFFNFQFSGLESVFDAFFWLSKTEY